MRHDRLAVVCTLAVIVALTLATGPSIGLLTVPEGGVGTEAAIGTGSAIVEVQTAPGRANLTAGDYGDVHYLEVPDAEIAVERAAGAPLVTASIDVDELGFSRSSVYVLRETRDGTRTVSIDRGSLDSSRVDSDSYEGRYRLVIRDDGGKRVLYDEPITIEVRE